MSKEKVLPQVVKSAFTRLVNNAIEIDDDDICDDLKTLGAFIFGEESVKELYPTLFNEESDEEEEDENEVEG